MVYSRNIGVNKAFYGEARGMKAVTEVFSSQQKKQGTSISSKTTPPKRVARYLVVATLLTVVYHLSSWTPTEPDLISFSAVPSFIVFWLGGGVITLGLLALAAKRRTSK
jgi:hypothetical protein